MRQGYIEYEGQELRIIAGGAPVLDALAAEVTSDVTVMGSATTLINGIAARVQAAVDAALANGATAAELAPVTDEIAALNAAAAALSQAVAANT